MKATVRALIRSVAVAATVGVGLIAAPQVGLPGTTSIAHAASCSNPLDNPYLSTTTLGDGHTYVAAQVNYDCLSTSTQVTTEYILSSDPNQPTYDFNWYPTTTGQGSNTQYKQYSGRTCWTVDAFEGGYYTGFNSIDTNTLQHCGH